jgi:hypothetical protein
MKKRSGIASVIILAMVFAFTLTTIGAPAAFAAKAKSGMVLGMLDKAGDDYVITTSGKGGKMTVVVTGQDFSSFVGKKVKATGTFDDSKDKKTLNVTKIEAVTGKKGKK